MSSSTARLDVEATIFKRLHPHIFLSRFLASTPSIRDDGRSPSSSRAVSAVLGSLASARGSCLVRLGRTTVVAAVSAEVARPRDEAPECGFVVPSIDMSPLCSPRFRPGPPGEEAQVVLDRIMAVLDA
jgi:exosome complex component RRP43